MENKKMFIAGASGVIGIRLCKMLVDEGWDVYGTTRSEKNVELLKGIGVNPIVIDVYNADELTEILTSIKPKVVYHQLTDLPDGLNPDKMQEALESNAKLRDIGTKNLVNASIKANVEKMIAQSIAFVYEPSDTPHNEESPLLNFDDEVYGSTSKAVASLEEQVLNAPFTGIILRNGLLYGEGTGFDTPVEYVPPVHVDAAVHAALLALNYENNDIFNITDDDKRVITSKAKELLNWNPEFRML